MKVLDRLSGQTLGELPAAGIPGRYRVLEEMHFNGHTTVHLNELLLDDGSGVLRHGQCEFAFSPIAQTDQEIADAELTSDAIVAIAEKLPFPDDGHVSPMLPAETVAKSELQELEIELMKVLQAGHLQVISERPKKDLRYEEEVAPVERARRLATDALTHLASHSDCWQQRTVSGVRPRKVLSRFSEDEYGIYENRLYKRLLDRLEKHLSGRRARIARTSECLEKHAKFQAGMRANRRLWEDICKLWGRAFEDVPNSNQLEASKDALEKIEQMLGMVRRLKQAGLYRLVPRSAVVPAQVHRTNILTHDLHYRHLPPLWERLRSDIDEAQLPPEARLVRQQLLQQSYSDYVGLVLRRALQRYGIGYSQGRYAFHYAGLEFTVVCDLQDWVLKHPSGRELRFVPLTWFGEKVADGDQVAPNHILCWPGNAGSDSSEHRLHLSPLDLYVVEQMGRVIDVWLLRDVVESYGVPLGPLPKAVSALVQPWQGQFRFDTPTHARLIAPLDEEQVVSLRDAVRDSAGPRLKQDIEAAISRVSALCKCLCGQRVTLMSNPPSDFYCHCKACGSKWSLRTTGKVRAFTLRPRVEDDVAVSSDGFKWGGRDWLDFEVTA